MRTVPGRRRTCVEHSDGVPGDDGEQSTVGGEGGHGGHAELGAISLRVSFLVAFGCVCFIKVAQQRGSMLYVGATGTAQRILPSVVA